MHACMNECMNEGRKEGRNGWMMLDHQSIDHQIIMILFKQFYIILILTPTTSNIFFRRVRKPIGKQRRRRQIDYRYVGETNCLRMRAVNIYKIENIFYLNPKWKQLSFTIQNKTWAPFFPSLMRIMHENLKKTYPRPNGINVHSSVRLYRTFTNQ